MTGQSFWPTAAGLFLLCGVAAEAAPAPSTTRVSSLTVTPAAVRLKHLREEQAIRVTGTAAGGMPVDLTAQSVFSAPASAAAFVAEGAVVRPLRPGSVEIIVRAGGRTVRLPVTVEAPGIRPVSFLHEVLPVLTRAGCNQAACHGAQAGKGRLKLSLFGYDPTADHRALNGPPERPFLRPDDPESSLLLRKATARDSHGGGRRIVPGSLSQRVLVDWIRGGAPIPSDGVQLTRLDVDPPRARLAAAGRPLRLLVTARYSDGSSRDVTGLADYSAQDPEWLEVDQIGTITPTRAGANAAMVRYGGRVGVCELVIPYSRPLPRDAYPAALAPVDEPVFARLGELGLPLSPAADDLTFLRRVSMDLTGTLPTPDEIRAFQADCEKARAAAPKSGIPSLEARRRLVDRLLSRPEHAYYWAQKLSDLLKVNGRDLGRDGMLAYYGHLLRSVSRNVPWDRLARELLLGSPGEPGPGAYYETSRTAEERAVTTAEVFLGVRIGCAQCHQHPFEQWSQDDFWRFAAFFARVPTPGGVERLGGAPAPVPAASREVTNPRTGQPAYPPRVLGGPEMPEPDRGGNRRRLLVDWLTSPDNSWFSRALPNRVWRHLFGRGVVDPVDDFRATNPPSDPALLKFLGESFAGSGYDLRALLRMICASRVYQTASTPLPGNRADERHFSHALFRRLPAEPLADAIAQATGVPFDYAPYESGTRAIMLPDPEAAAPFLDAFGRPGRTQACECERSDEPSVGQALLLLTGPGLSSRVTGANGRIARLLFFTEQTPDQVIEELYLWSLSRPPRPAELSAWRAHLKERVAASPGNARGAAQEALEDWFWALLNSKEFLFNH